MLRSHKDCTCPHCRIAETIMAWRDGTQGTEFVAMQRQRFPDRIAGRSDEKVMRTGIVQGLAMALIQVIEEETDLDHREVLGIEFQMGVEAARNLERSRADPIGATQGNA